MTSVITEPGRADANKKTAQKLISGIRNLYQASSHLGDEEIKQRFKQLLNEFSKQAPPHLDTALIFQELGNHFSLQTQNPPPTQSETPSRAMAETPSLKPEHQDSESAAVNKEASVIQGLGYDAKLASLLLNQKELTLSPALQRKQMLARVQHAKQVAEQNGYQLMDLLENLDLVLKAKNESFFHAVNQSFYTIIHHLYPKRAKKLGLPLAPDLGQPRWFDLNRLRRLVEYIQCGRMAKDTATNYSRRLNRQIEQIKQKR